MWACGVASNFCHRDIDKTPCKAWNYLNTFARLILSSWGCEITNYHRKAIRGLLANCRMCARASKFYVKFCTTFEVSQSGFSKIKAQSAKEHRQWQQLSTCLSFKKEKLEQMLDKKDKVRLNSVASKRVSL